MKNEVKSTDDRLAPRPHVMETGWVRDIHGDLDGEALYKWAKRLEAAINNSFPRSMT